MLDDVSDPDQGTLDTWVHVKAGEGQISRCR
jgi:hypothetical protein